MEYFCIISNFSLGTTLYNQIFKNTHQKKKITFFDDITT